MIFFLKLLIERHKSEPKEASMSEAVVRRSFEDLSPLISRTPWWLKYIDLYFL